MPSNQELQAENKTLKQQLEKLQEQLKGDVVPKSNYDAVVVKLKEAEAKIADASFPTLQKEVESLHRQINTLTIERNQARDEVVAAGKQILALQATQRVETEPMITDRHENLAINTSELRQLTALCLSKATDDLGRVIPEKSLDREVPKLVSTAIYIAKEIASQIP